MAKLIFGCGYLGRRVARLWLREGEAVYAVTRSAEKGRLLAAEGIRPLVADLFLGEGPELPEGLRSVLFAVGFDRGSSRPIEDVYTGGVARALSWMPKSLERFIYIST